MLILKYCSFDFDKQLNELASSVTSYHYGRKITLKKEIGTGDFKVLQFPNRLKAVVANYTLHQDFFGERENVNADYFMLHVNQVKTGTAFSVLINEQEIDFNDTFYTSVFLTDYNEPFGLKGSKGTHFNQLKIIIPKNWPSQFLGDVVTEDLLNNYFNLKEERLFFDDVDPNYRHLTEKLVQTEDNIFYLSVTQSIAGAITQQFFYHMCNKLQQRKEGLSRMAVNSEG